MESGSEEKKKTILVIEDDTFLGNILVKYISSKNVSALIAKSGEEALKIIEGSVPDVIILDIFLPGMNGMEFLEKLRTDQKCKDIPVMVVSNTNQPEDRERAKSLGASFFLKASMTPQDIVNNLEAIIDPPYRATL